MIARHWRGLARREHAESYVEHLRSDVELGVEFLIVTRWKSATAIRAFAGSDPEAAVVPASVQRMMVEYDERARHFEIVG
jgi:heme-degrading monooxygenase HmoA